MKVMTFYQFKQYLGILWIHFFYFVKHFLGWLLITNF